MSNRHLLFFESEELCGPSYKDRGGKCQGQTSVTLPRTRETTQPDCHELPAIGIYPDSVSRVLADSQHSTIMLSI